MKNKTLIIANVLFSTLLVFSILVGCSGCGGRIVQEPQPSRPTLTELLPRETDQLRNSTSPNNTETDSFPTEPPLSMEIKGTMVYFSHQNVQSIMRMDLESGSVSEIFSDVESPPISMFLSPDQKMIAFSSTMISEEEPTEAKEYLRVLAIETKELIFSALEYSACDENIVGYSWSPDSQYIAFSCGGDIWIYDLSNGQIVNITNSQERELWPSWSPDGEKLLYSRISENLFDLFLVSIQKGEVIRLTNLESPSVLKGVWSPDGSSIAFYGNENNLLMIAADGKTMTNLVQNQSSTYDISWSPDSSKIAFRSKVDGDYEVFWIEINSQKTHQITNNNVDEYYPIWSPFGDLIAFISNTDLSSPYFNIFISDELGIMREQMTYEEYGVANPIWLP